MSKHLFDGFEKVSSKQWKQQIQFELKGADYNETLVWESPEGIKVKPFYHNDEFIPAAPAGTKAANFSICQNIFVFDIDKSIARANDTLNRGAESIRFTIDNDKTDVEKLLNGITAKETPVYISLGFLSIDFVKRIDAVAKQKNLTIYVQLDPIGNLAKEGNWFHSMEKDLDILNTVAIACSNISFLSIDGSLYQNAGAGIVQQTAYTLAQANEYFNTIATINKPIVLQVAIGTNYFFEIAKLRALRKLFRLIANEYNHTEDCHIIATPSKRNKTLYDYNVNMLRTTTECMSAILGGADAVANLPYDALYHKDNEFGDRIARNQLLVLKHESYFDKVDNPADGAYYIEELTQQIAEKALTLFKDIEANGGFLHQLKEGTIQRKIQESAAKEQELFNNGKEVLLGTNKYPNKNDKMYHELELYPFVKTDPRKTLITPIIEKRLAEQMERERLNEEEKTCC
ncbi:methylmalonyl-CoA mutase [Flavobacterium salilacus subsp. salilacus]|uniref:methylmalonyl-CoA mutase subunit beta n=1 Tax=Flavobacterium TaxID=237 RepID=UPI001075665F|nr:MULTISPECIES: methylmalonyl-CoA mutase subunit beta [Flavobacterium]KAF2519497.1 methylmalonyl-CoA mutase [Flavobacterium salilacus subsp. salilacus]MBE1614606.1 methylmalonyl-CoA mutase subunit beta [Flavobacterium sp. SaA2.13]